VYQFEGRERGNNLSGRMHSLKRRSNSLEGRTLKISESKNHLPIHVLPKYIDTNDGGMVNRRFRFFLFFFLPLFAFWTDAMR
jgi:hypothetical protein